MSLPREQISDDACPKEESGKQAPPADAAKKKVGPNAAGSVSAEDAMIEQLVELAQGGDRESFDKLVVLFQDKVWRRAYYRTRNQEEASDVTQEVFLTCFRKLHQFRGEAKFWTWLGRIVDNHVKNRYAWLERRGRSKTYSLDAPLNNSEGDDAVTFDPPDESASPRRQAEDRQTVEAMMEKMGELSEDHREVLMLRFAENQTYEEISETLDISLGTVKSRINRARAELREKMKDYLD